MLRIATVIAGDADRAVAGWLTGRVHLRGDAESDVLDLGAACLPDVPRGDLPTPAAVHDLAPWLAEADAFLLVLRNGLPAPVRHALSWCGDCWKGKPVALVSHGPAPPADTEARTLLDAVQAIPAGPTLHLAGAAETPETPDPQADQLIARLIRSAGVTPDLTPRRK